MLTKNCRRIPCWLISRRLAISDGIQSRFPIDKPVPYDLVKRIMGKRMFDGGERYWPEEAPFHTPVFVLTHEVRKPWERPGGTTFYFVNDGIRSALRQARKAAGNRDVRIAGGAKVIQQYLNAGSVDEFTIHYSPVFFGQGLPLFSGMSKNINAKIKKAVASKEVTHVTYKVGK